jgi:acetyl-CoA carboxylase biotin carboxyl carrier protein
VTEEDLKEIKKIFKFMVKEDLVELDVQDKDYKLKLRRKETRAHTSAAPLVVDLEPASRTKENGEKIIDGAVKITAPLGGVFYRSPAPGADSFVTEEEEVKKGQTLCIIEAMKMMNEIQSEVSGKLVKIVPENGKRVDAGETLFLVIPA